MKTYLSTAIFITVLFFYADGFSGDYHSQTLIKANWGQADGEFGLLLEAEGNCPQSLAIDNNGNLAILDLVYKRVQLYSSAGKWLGKFSITSQAFDIQYLNEQLILLAPYDYLIEQYDPQGRLIKKVSISREIEFINGLRIAGNDILVQTIEQTQYEVSKESQSRQRPVITPGLNARIPDLKFQTRWIDANQGQLSIETKGTGKQQTIIITTQDELGSLVFLDTDSSGNIYLRKELFDPAGKSYFEVDQMDQHGSVLSTIRIPNENIVAPFKPITIDREGNIYFLQIESRGLAVIRWQSVK